MPGSAPAPSQPPRLPERPGPSPYPGFDLGLPERGPRSMGRLGRRILALLIDWGLALLLSTAFFHYNSFASLIIFAVVQIVFLIVIGGSIGHLVCRLRVTPLAGGTLGIWRPIVRTILICIVIPAVIYDRDQRGLHDRACATILVRV